MKNKIESTISYLYGKYDLRKGDVNRAKMDNVLRACMEDIEKHPFIADALDSQKKIEFFVMQTILGMVPENQ